MRGMDAISAAAENHNIPFGRMRQHGSSKALSQSYNISCERSTAIAFLP